MSSFNKVMPIGNLGSDPEIRNTQDGPRLRRSRWPRQKDGVPRRRRKLEKIEWHRVVLWNKLAEIVEKYVHKGSKICVEGRPETRKWTDRDGIERYTTQIVVSGFGEKLVMLGSPNGAAGQPARDEQGPQQHDDAGLDDDISF